MTEEELEELLEEEGFVDSEPVPNLPRNYPEYWIVDRATGIVGIGTADPVNARFHIVDDRETPTVRIIQKGRGDSLLIDNRRLSDQNGPPTIPYLNIKNDGRIGIGTSQPLSEIHLITDAENSNILIGELPDNTGSATDSGISFTGLANTVTSALFTEVDGALISLGANVGQAGIVDTSRVGGIIRIDTRKTGDLGVGANPGTGNSSCFTIKGVGIGESIGDEYTAYTTNLDTGDTFIAPDRGDVFVVAFSTSTSLGVATDRVIPYYRFYNNGNAGIAGTLTLPDISEITLGISSDLTLFHDPVTENSYIIEDNPNGSLVIAGDNIEFRDTSLVDLYAQFNTDSGVELFFNNEKRLETVGTGISIFSGLAGTSNVATIFGPSEIVIDPSPIGVGTTSGLVRIKGDLYVEGRQTIIDSTIVTIADIQIGIGTSVSSDTLGFATANALLDTGGITIGVGTVQKSFTYNLASDSLKSSENIDLGIGKTYRIDGNDVLSATTLGTGVTDSSLTNVDTLIDLEVIGVTSIGVLPIGGGPGFSSPTDNFTVYLPSRFDNTANFDNTVTIGEDITVAAALDKLTVNSISTFRSGLTANNIAIEGTEGTPVAAGVGILTVAAISLPNPIDGGYGNAGDILVSTGSTVYNTTGIGLSWVEIDTDISIVTYDSPGGGAASPSAIFRIATTPTTNPSTPDEPLGVTTALFVSDGGLEYNHSTNLLSDVNGKYRAIPQEINPSGGIDRSYVGRHVIIDSYSAVTGIGASFRNGFFDIGDAVTIVNTVGTAVTGQVNVSWQDPLDPGLFTVSPFEGSVSEVAMIPFSIATFLCIDNAGGQTSFIVAGNGIFGI